MSFIVGDEVFKAGAQGGYEGPGTVACAFKNWMGQPRYVVGHRIDGGKGLFYHIYSDRELTLLRRKGKKESKQGDLDD